MFNYSTSSHVVSTFSLGPPALVCEKLIFLFILLCKNRSFLTRVDDPFEYRHLNTFVGSTPHNSTGKSIQRNWCSAQNNTIEKPQNVLAKTKQNLQNLIDLVLLSC